MEKIQELAMPTGRVLIAVMFVLAGVGKIFAFADTQGFMEAFGVPGSLLIPTILFEIGAGLAVIIGWQTRLAALALAGFSVVSAIIFHADFADPVQSTIFLKNVGLAGGFLFLVANGAGAYSLDNRKKAA
ncbi:MAG: DoxX family protein [Rhodobacteraceae bacterium]|nr:DoxX family protein [Paracoccaceae bacterium]